MNKIEVNSYAMKYARNVEQWVVDNIYDTTDFAFIFGGAIRDSIVNDPINDIDIL